VTNREAKNFPFLNNNLPIWGVGGAWTVGIRLESAEKAAPKRHLFAKQQLLANNSGLSFDVCGLEFQRTCQEKLFAIRGVSSVGVRATEVMTAGETEALYERALQSFGEIAEKSVNEANNNSRKRTFVEFQQFLSRNAYGVTVETATAADVGAFIVGDWIPKHSAGCRTKLPSTGQPVPSVSAVNSVVKHLSKSYALLGYEGRSNPAKAEVVKAFRTGYEKALHEEGVKVQRAKVFTEAKLDAR
jgi:hypothetical protein